MFQAKGAFMENGARCFTVLLALAGNHKMIAILLTLKSVSKLLHAIQ
jgi:hypothetical protein